MRIISLLFLFLLASACADQPSYRTSDAPLETVASVDLDQYLGKWYEIARLPNSFEKGCEGVTATYSRRDDNLIKVVNACRMGSLDGKLKIANGRARIVDQETNAKLEVSFFGPFWGDYWVIHLEPDYSISMVSEPEGRYLWILSRTPTLTEMTIDRLLGKLEEMGFDTDSLYFPAQASEPEASQP